MKWEDTPDNIRYSVIHGVLFLLDEDEIKSPRTSHEEWCNYKIKEGWTYGEVKDVVNKKHPNLVPYYKLPDAQKAKDYIFRAIVESLKDL